MGGAAMSTFSADLYIIGPRRVAPPDIEVRIHSMGRERAEQALLGMAQALANTMQNSVRIVGHGEVYSHPQTVSPATDK